MSSRALSLSELDRLIEATGLPVRADTLEEVWTEGTTPDRISSPGGKFLLLVSMHAKEEFAAQFEQEVLDFVALTNRLSGVEGTTVHRSDNDPLAWCLLERFRDQQALNRHMAGEHFRHFQFVQRTLLTSPVEVFFLAGARP